MKTVEWWQNAVIYQIVPWSFLDTDGDGKGNLDGIIRKLDYICALGVDAIWLTPIYESPMDDLGYDVVDMREIDPSLGTLEIFDKMLALIHARGLRLIVDQVWGHTSNRHSWFKQSCASRDNPKADWYVWADPKPDGSPPNNWLSAFNGKSAWRWEEQRQQYYLYHFLASQPKLNWFNPQVREALMQRARFWLERGVDGFRLDAPNFFLHDRQLRDEPHRPADSPEPDGIDMGNPMAHQLFKYSFCHPEVPKILESIRQLVDEYPGVTTLAEVTLCEDSIQLSSEYVAGTHLAHLAYNSALLVDQPISAKLMHDTLSKVQTAFGSSGNCWMVGNHDYGRLRSRWSGQTAEGEPYPEEFYHLAAAMLTAMPGALCLYQGDELGLAEARIPTDIPPDEIVDPFGQALYPDVVGRDGSRTPMPWQRDKLSAGFSTVEEPWLPVPDHHRPRAVDQQTNDPHSLLNTWRRLMHWRKQQPALMQGSCQILDAPEPVFAFIRETAEQQLLCVFNIGPGSATYRVPEDRPCSAALGTSASSEQADKTIQLHGYGFFFGNLEPRTDPLNSGSARELNSHTPMTGVVSR